MILILQLILSLFILLFIYLLVKEKIKNDKLTIENMELKKKIEHWKNQACNLLFKNNDKQR